MFKNKCIIFNIVLLLTYTLMAQEDEKIVREIVLARFRRLQNLIVDYKVTQEFHLPPGFDPQNAIRKTVHGFDIIKTGTLVETKEFSVLKNRVLYDQNFVSWDRKIERPDLDLDKLHIERSVYVFNLDRVERLQVSKGSGVPHGHGAIKNHAGLPYGDIDIALGLRRYGDNVLLTEKLIKEMTIDLSNSEQVILAYVDSGRSIYEWVFDRKLGYALTCCRKREVGVPDNLVNVEFVMEEFKNVDGIMLPLKARGKIQKWRNGQKQPVKEYDIQVFAYRLNDPTNTPERYRMKWPEGTRIIDERSGIQFLIKGGQMIYARDEDIFEMALDEISKAEVNEPKTSAHSHDIDEQEDVNAVEDEPANLPVGDIVPPMEPQKLSSQFWWAGVFAMAVVFVSLFIYRKHKASP